MAGMPDLSKIPTKIMTGKNTSAMQDIPNAAVNQKPLPELGVASPRQKPMTMLQEAHSHLYDQDK